MADDIINPNQLETATKDELLQLIVTALEHNDAFATEFAGRVIPYLSHQIRENINVTPIIVNGKLVSERIIQILTDETEPAAKKVAKQLSKQIEESNKTIEQNIKEAAKAPKPESPKTKIPKADKPKTPKVIEDTDGEKAVVQADKQKEITAIKAATALKEVEESIKPVKENKDQLSLDGLFNTPKDDILPLQLRYIGMKWKILNRISTALDKANEFNITDFTLSKLFNINPITDFLLTQQLYSTKKQILTRIEKGLLKPSTTEALPILSLPSLFGSNPIIENLLLLKYLKVKYKMLDSIEKGLDKPLDKPKINKKEHVEKELILPSNDSSKTEIDKLNTPKLKSDVVVPGKIVKEFKEDKEDKNKPSEYKSTLEEEPQEVTIAEFSLNSQRQITKLLEKVNKQSPDIIETKKKEDIQSGIFTDAATFAKKAAIAVAAVAGAAALGTILGTVVDKALGISSKITDAAGGEQIKAQQTEHATKKGIEAVSGGGHMDNVRAQQAYKETDEYKAEEEKINKLQALAFKMQHPEQREDLYKDIRKRREELDQKILREAGRAVKIQQSNPLQEPQIKEQIPTPTKADDFIWRPGQPVQKFAADDYIVGSKTPEGVKYLTDRAQGKSVEKTAETNKQNEMLTHLTTNINALITQLQTQSVTPSRTTEIDKSYQAQPLPGITNNAGEIRDPAYILRGRMWDRLRDAYVLV